MFVNKIAANGKPPSKAGFRYSEVRVWNPPWNLAHKTSETEYHFMSFAIRCPVREALILLDFRKHRITSENTVDSPLLARIQEVGGSNPPQVHQFSSGVVGSPAVPERFTPPISPSEASQKPIKASSSTREQRGLTRSDRAHGR
jgi:hypothetical protein